MSAPRTTRQDYRPSLATQLARPSCTRCRSAVRWLTVAQAYRLFGRQVTDRLLRMAAVVPGEPCDFWMCSRCDQEGLVTGPDPS